MSRKSGSSKEELISLIKSFALQAIESRQAARRMLELLPVRFAELRYQHEKGGLGRFKARSLRQTYMDERYLDYLDKMIDVRDHALKNRIQYETHMMLYDARQSLNVKSRREAN